jgi:L-fucose isomerase-like protein|tara:strand:+ start:263 stop:658 length:396 start_codon:yes stop_codon:yes gene_type:complete
MKKKYLSKIIANDNEGLQMISACCAEAEIKVSDIKYLQKNKVFLLSLRRNKIETENEGKKVNSICKFEFVDSVKSKNINQENVDQKLELITMDYLKNNNNYEISLIFTNNAYITLSTEIIEVTLDDQNKID